MSTIALSGNDSVIVNNRILNDFADATYAELTYPNNIGNAKVGKNGNVIFAQNATGRLSELKLKLIRGSSDDKFLMQLCNLQDNNFAGTVLLAGSYVKNIGDGAGNLKTDTYVTNSGIFTKFPGAKSDSEGNTEQSTTEYVIQYANTARIIS